MSQVDPSAAAVAADVVSFVDEAGDRGYVRKLTGENDHNIGVFCALPVPVAHLDTVRDAIRPAYDRFCAAAPPGAKHHITDAFKPGNEAWAAVAYEVRDEILAAMLNMHLRVVYVARRSRVARKTHELNEDTRDDAKAAAAAFGPRTHVVQGANRPSNETVDDQLMIDLSLMIDIFMESAEMKVSDFYFDQIDASIAERYRKTIERTRHISFSKHDVTARNLATGENEARTVEMRVPGIEVDVTHVGSIVVAGKSDPLVFAADVVANHLWRHLKTASADAPLNDGRALQGWVLEPITYYNREFGATLMDIL